MSHDCVYRQVKFHRFTENDKRQIERYAIIKNFCRSPENVACSIASLGCGPFEPIRINATHACDDSQLAGDFLKANGWKGDFIVADVCNLPYSRHQFDIAICSEVIEHLPTEAAVTSAIIEVSRVAKSWLITTPFGYSPDPEHHFHFTDTQLKKILKAALPANNLQIFIKGFFFYITNDEQRLNKAIPTNS